MLLLLFAAAAPGRERAALQADLDSLATTLDSMLDHERRANPIAWIDNMGQVGDGKGDYNPLDGRYPKFNNDAEAAEYFTAEGVFTEEPEAEAEAEEQLVRLAGSLKPSWTSLDVVFSFGAANGGYANVVKVKGILQDKGLNAYIDSEYLPSVEGSYLIPMANGNSFPRNVNWKVWYMRAMLDARAMIFIVTPEWLTSPFCEMELTWAVKRRVGGDYLNIVFTSPDLLEIDPKKKGAFIPVKPALLTKLSNLFFNNAVNAMEFHVVPYIGPDGQTMEDLAKGIGDQKNDMVTYMKEWSPLGYVKVTATPGSISYTDADRNQLRAKVNV